ncbi:MAG: enoyl-CoA hydratase-related protein [Planctomycetota bacterium]
MADPAEVSLSVASGIGTIALDRPKANAYTVDLLQRLLDTVDAADGSADARVVLIRSALPRFFCAGADVKAFEANSTETNHRLVELARAVVARIESSGKLFVAVIQGHALGGGLELAMGCDLRWAAAGEYLLGLPEVKLGLIPGNGGCVRLPRLIGPSRALDMLATGRSVMPDEAAAMGLVDRLIPADGFDDEVAGQAQTLASAAPLAVAAIKRYLRESQGLGLDDSLALETRCVEPLYDSADAAEGLAAFVEKREARFTGA